MEAAERLERLADRVLVGPAGRVDLAAGARGEPVELVAGMDPVQIVGQAQLSVGQLGVLRFLADADLVGLRPPFHWIVAVPTLFGLAARCTDLLTPY